MAQENEYLIQGKGETVVLLHSSMSSKTQWQKLISDLVPDFRIIAADLYGYGTCPYPENSEQFSLEQEVNRIEMIIAQEVQSDETIHLVGHSYGGAVSLKLSHKLSNKVKSLTLYEPVAFHLLQQDETAYLEIQTLVNKIKHTLKLSDKRKATSLFINYWSGKGYFEKLPHAIQTGFIKEIDKVVLDFKALTEETLSLQDYSEITSHTCLITGNQSPVSSRRISMLIRQTLPGLDYNQVDGGHMAPITHADTINPIITAFLNRHTSD